MAMKVGEFLQALPELKFDVVAHLESTRYVPQLISRINQTRRWASECWLPVPVPVPAEPRVPKLLGAPLLTADDLRNDLTSYLVRDEMGNGPPWAKWTSGTTGPPLLVPYAAEFFFDQLHLPAVRAALFLWGEVDRSDVFTVSLTDSRSSDELVIDDPTGTVGLTVQLRISEAEERSISRAWSVVERFQPAVLIVKPVILEVLLRHRELIPRSHTLRLVFSSGSLLAPELQRLAEEVLLTKVVSCYGLTEFGIMSFQCDAMSMHYDPSVFELEVVDPRTGELAQDGWGVLVVTTRTNPLLPLTRYRTGDVGILTPRSCACGRRGPRITQLGGRVQSCFRGARGEFLSPVHFRALFKDPIREYQVVQHSPGSFHVRVEPRDGASGTMIRQLTEQRVRQLVPPGSTIQVEITEIEAEVGFQRHIVSSDKC